MSAAEALPTVPTPEGGDAANAPRRSGSFWGDVLRRVRRSPAAWIGAIVIAVFVLVALLAPWLAPYPELATPAREYLRPTSLPGIGEIPEFPLGIDRFGGDVVSKLIWGAQASPPKRSMPSGSSGISPMPGSDVGRRYSRPGVASSG